MLKNETMNITEVMTQLMYEIIKQTNICRIIG